MRTIIRQTSSEALAPPRRPVLKPNALVYKHDHHSPQTRGSIVDNNLKLCVAAIERQHEHSCYIFFLRLDDVRGSEYWHSTRLHIIVSPIYTGYLG